MGNRSNKSPLRISGIVFAIAANLLAVTLSTMAAGRIQLPVSAELVVIMIGPLLAGFATALYTGTRGGMYAFIGGMLSIPIAAYLIFPGNWQPAILSGATCALGGAITEKLATLLDHDNGRLQ